MAFVEGRGWGEELDLGGCVAGGCLCVFVIEDQVTGAIHAEEGGGGRVGGAEDYAPVGVHNGVLPVSSGLGGRASADEKCLWRRGGRNGYSWGRRRGRRGGRGWGT